MIPLTCIDFWRADYDAGCPDDHLHPIRANRACEAQTVFHWLSYSVALCCHCVDRLQDPTALGPLPSTFGADLPVAWQIALLDAHRARLAELWRGIPKERVH